MLVVPVAAFVVFRALAWMGIPFFRVQFGGDVSFIWPLLKVMAHHGLRVGNLGSVSQANNEFYPYPFAILLTPLGWLSYTWAASLGSLLSALCLSISIAVWRRAFPDVRHSWVLLVLLGLPGLDLVLIGQLLTAIGFVGASLAAAAAARGRWFSAGLAAVFATMRPDHLVVLALFVLVCFMPRRRRDLLSLIGGYAALFLPLGLAATLLHPTWLSDWVANVSNYSSPVGVILAVVRQLGRAGDALLAALVVLIALEVRRLIRTDGPPFLVAVAWAIGFAVSSIVAPTPSFYAFIYILPLELALVWSGRWLFVLLTFLVIPWGLVGYNFAHSSFPGAQLANLALTAAYLCGAALVLIGVQNVTGLLTRSGRPAGQSMSYDERSIQALSVVGGFIREGNPSLPRTEEEAL